MSDAQSVAARAMSTTENRSMGPTLLGGATDWASVLETAIVITPLAAGAAIGRTACAPVAFFPPDCPVGPGVGLRLHRIMRRRTLAGFTADRGFTPLPRRPLTKVADSFRALPSVFEVALAGEDHGDTCGIGGRDRLAIFQRAARLDDRPHARARRHLNTIRVREEAVAGQNRAAHTRGPTMDGQLDGFDPAHLPGTNSDRGSLKRQHDGVRAHVLYDSPGELQVLPGCVIGRLRRHDSSLAQGAAAEIRRLHQESAGDGPRIQGQIRGPGPGLQHPQ